MGGLDGPPNPPLSLGIAPAEPGRAAGTRALSQ
jgi:hypothetical protein